MGCSKHTRCLFSRAIGLSCGLILSAASYGQADSTQAAPKAFFFSKYQLSAQGSLGSTSFFSVPLKASPYKIHYKIKTLTFPADTRPERPTSIVGALVNGIVETATNDLFNNDCEEKNKFLVPIKPTNTVKY